MLNLLLVLLCVVRCGADWELEWSDEFNDNSLDTTKWQIVDEEVACDGNFIHSLNCKVNSSRNVQLVDGCLAIAAIRHKHLDKEYTSGAIRSVDNFTFGRFEFRAALPRGKMLRPAIWMSPIKYSGQWPTDGQIDVLTNIQTKSIGNGIHILTTKIEYEGPEYRTGANLNDFHTYAVEWNESTILYRFDGKQHFAINTTQRYGNYYNPYKSPFRLELTLGVGGQFFINQVLLPEEVSDWQCSLFLLDYIRVYRWNENHVNVTNGTEERVSSSEICAAIMPLIRPGRPLNIPFIPIVAVLSLVLLLTLIPLVVYLFIRQKNIKRRVPIDEVYEIYDDNFDVETNTYEAVKDEEEYADPYDKTGNSNTNYYSKSFAKMQDSDDNPNYLQMTNAYIEKPNQRNSP